MKRLTQAVTKAAVGLVFLVGVVLLLLWLAGFFESKIGVEEQTGIAARPLPKGAETVAVRFIEVPLSESAVGTVEADRQTTVASRILSRVVSIDVEAGRYVEEGEVLATLDDSDLRQRLEQSQAVLDAARAALDQAREELARSERSAAQGAASELEVIRARNTVRASEAEVTRAERAVAEAQTVLGYAVVRAPFAGVVIERLAEVGDTVTPGMPLVTMYDPTRMQLVASVRESLTVRLAVGSKVTAEIESLGLECEAEVIEIVPEASARSRSFQVKVAGPCPPGVYPGMFGRISIPLENARVLVIPASAVQRVGQLDLVDVVQGGSVVRRAIQTGRQFDDGTIEVLSGLREGEQVVITEIAEQGA